jgi:hypothetical protein
VNLRIRRLLPSEFVNGHAYLYVGDQASDTPAVLEFFGEIEHAPNSTDGEGNPIYDGPTEQGWQPVPIVEAQ